MKGLAAVSPAAAIPWSPPPNVKQSETPGTPLLPITAPNQDPTPLTLAAIMDIALSHNPATQAAWAEARAAAAQYGSTRGARFPSVNLDSNATYTKGNAAQSSSGANADLSDNGVTEATVTITLSYLLLDFGGRSARVEEARQALLAANWTQNAAIRSTALQVQVAFFSHVGAITLLEAHQTSLQEAEANLTAATERHRIGLATYADVLQAKTAQAEIKLAVQRAIGDVRTTRGALAVVMGYPAHTPLDINTQIPEIPAAEMTQTVNQLIEQAISLRPDLQASRAQTKGAAVRVKELRSKMMPSLSTTGSSSWLRLKGLPDTRHSYGVSLLLQVPIFNGFSRQFDLKQAKAALEASQERTRGVAQTITFQVYSAHSDFLTACERIKTTRELVTSAQQSEEMALGRYKEGVGNILDLLSAQRALAMARAEQINARLSWFITLAQLAHDVGVLGLQGDNPLTPTTDGPRR